MIKTDENILFINAKENMNEDVDLLLHMLHRYFSNISKLIGINHETILEHIKKTKDKIDVIVMDHEVYKGVKLLENILKIDSNFNILIISGSANCSEINSCDYCKEHYNKIRLLIPIEKKKLIDHIRNFKAYSCEYEKKCEEINQNLFLY